MVFMFVGLKLMVLVVWEVFVGIVFGVINGVFLGFIGFYFVLGVMYL